MEQWMPTAVMVATNIVIAVMTALLKQALNQGMNRLVLVTFRQMLATVFLGPIAYFKERYHHHQKQRQINHGDKAPTSTSSCGWYCTVADHAHALPFFLLSGRQDQSSLLKSLCTCSLVESSARCCFSTRSSSDWSTQQQHLLQLSPICSQWLPSSYHSPSGNVPFFWYQKDIFVKIACRSAIKFHDLLGTIISLN